MTEARKVLAYEFNPHVLTRSLEKAKLPGEAILLFRVLRDGLHTYDHLVDSGYSPRTIKFLEENEVLRQVEVQEPKIKRALTRDGFYVETEKTSTTPRAVQDRRSRLLRGFILPLFGGEEKATPQVIGVGELVDRVYSTEEGKDFLETNYTFTTYKALLQTVRKDLRSLGIRPMTQFEVRRSPYWQKISEKISGVLKRKLATDESYREGERSRIQAAHAAWMEGINFRRSQLLEKIIVPYLGNGEDGKQVPESLLVARLIDLMGEREPDFLQAYYGGLTRDALSGKIWMDVRALGIRTENQKEGADHISRKLKEKLEKDPEYKAGCMARFTRVDQARAEWQSSQENRKEMGRRSGEARKRKMEIDKEYREKTLANLAKGAGASWDREVLGEEEYQRRIAKAKSGLAKGTQVSIDRANIRRKALLEQVIIPEFGSLDAKSGKRRFGHEKVVDALLQNHQDVFIEHYVRWKGYESLVKKDLIKLRGEQGAEDAPRN